MAHRRLAFAASMRVVVGVHNRAADSRTYAEVSCLAGFAHADDFVFEVAYLTDCRLAFKRNQSHFARGHFDSRVSAFLCHNLRGNACRTRYLRASAGFQFDRVNDGTYGDIG